MTGTFTYLFTDIEGSTRLVEMLGDAYVNLLEDYYAILRAAVSSNNGTVLGTEGDGCAFFFGRATDAVLAANEAQLALAAHEWPAGVDMRVRMGLHTGEVRVSGARHVGVTLHKAARISAAGHGGQTLISRITHDLVASSLQADIAVRDLGDHRLKDLGQPERIYQLTPVGLADEFLPLKTLDNRPNNLPSLLTSFIGRDAEIAELKKLLDTSRLVTVLGPGGAGKTRLALQTAAEMVEPFEGGAWLIDLSSTTDGEHLPLTVASALGLRKSSGSGSDGEDEQSEGGVERLISHIRSSRTFLIMDNCEHLVKACADLVSSLLTSCPGLSLLATSREPLAVPGEVRWRIPPMKVADGHSAADSEAVHLFVDRATLNDPSFTLNDTNAFGVAEICRRLEGMPLAIELSAAWVNVLSAAEILSRLDNQFRLLASSVRRGPDRQQTLRATVDWSYELLSEPERILLENLAIFSGSFSLEAAEAVCATKGLSSGEILHVLSRLMDKSLVMKDSDTGRFRLLETIRQYAAEKLEAPGEENEPPSQTSAPSEASSGPIFRKDADFWTVGSPRSPAHLSHSKGLVYLHILLSNPGRERHVLDLISEAEKGTPRAGSRRELSRQSDTGAVIDEKAKKAYQLKIAELEEEVEDARQMGDAARAARASEQKDTLAAELARAYGLGGRTRRENDPSEKARMSVGKAIRGAIQKIEENDAALGLHLRRSVKAGVFCSYSPEPAEALSWQF